MLFVNPNSTFICVSIETEFETTVIPLSARNQNSRMKPAVNRSEGNKNVYCVCYLAVAYAFSSSLLAFAIPIVVHLLNAASALRRHKVVRDNTGS